MVFDLDLIKKVYAELPAKTAEARKLTGRPLTLAEKILYAHLWEKSTRAYERGKDYVNSPRIVWRCRMPPLKWRCSNL